MSASRLQPNALLILSSLVDEERHGYAIRKDIAARCGEQLGITTLYRLLNNLLDAGLVVESPRRPAPVEDDERRRYFRITAAGRRALRAEVGRLERVLAAVRSTHG